MRSTLSTIDRTVQNTYEWIHDAVEVSGRPDREKAFQAMRAVLHVLRDRLTVAEAAHLAAQLPVLIRGYYYEGWKPSEQPLRLRSRDEFVQAVAGELSGHPEINPLEAIEMTFAVLNHRVTGGQIDDIKRMLPPAIREFWPEAA